MEKAKISIKVNTKSAVNVKQKHTTIPNDYEKLKNLPKINGVSLLGDLSENDLFLLSNLLSKYESISLDESSKIIMFSKNNIPVVMPLKDVLDFVKSFDNGSAVEIDDDGDVEQTINPNVYYNFTGVLTSLVISFGEEKTNRENEFKGQFTVGSTIPTVTFPSSVKWIGEEFPELEENKTYQFSVLNNIGVIVGL